MEHCAVRCERRGGEVRGSGGRGGEVAARLEEREEERGRVLPRRPAEQCAALVELLLASKRCPAWCDRVLMDRTGGALVAASAVTAEYGHEPQPRVLTDHNQVYLAFSVESR